MNKRGVHDLGGLPGGPIDGARVDQADQGAHQRTVRTAHGCRAGREPDAWSGADLQAHDHAVYRLAAQRSHGRRLIQGDRLPVLLDWRAPGHVLGQGTAVLAGREGEQVPCRRIGAQNAGIGIVQDHALGQGGEHGVQESRVLFDLPPGCLLYTSPSPRDS